MKTLFLTLLLAITAATAAGCASSPAGSPPAPELTVGNLEVHEIPDVEIPTAKGIDVRETEKAAIDFSCTDKGYIQVAVKEPPDGLLWAVTIETPPGYKYTYVINPSALNGGYLTFPLSEGNGVYKAGVHKQVDGSRYAMELAVELNVKLTNSLYPFLIPNYYVDFCPDSKSTKLAHSLTEGSDFSGKVTSIYKYVTGSIKYDTELANGIIEGTAGKNYVPVLDNVIDSGKGICFDYASLTAAMLRSVSIPTRLVFGYADGVYHAWISVWCESEGWLDGIIYFNSNNWTLIDPTFGSNRSVTELNKFIGEGNHYAVVYVY